MRYQIDEQSKNCICGNSFEFSVETDKIIPAFIKAQGAISFSKKGAVNPFFKDDKTKKDGKYSELADVWAVISQPMKDNKLCIMWFIATTGLVEVMLKNMITKAIKGQYGTYDKLVWQGDYIKVFVREVIVTTMLMHESGQWVKTWITMTPDGNGSQAKGATITYAKRYSVASLFGVCPVGEDTDGNPTTSNDTKKQEPMQKKEYSKDKNGIVRYNKTDNVLNDKYQVEKGLVVTEQLVNIHELVKYNLGGNFEKFYNWLFDVYKVIFWDIKQNMVAGIMQTLSNDSSIIMEHKRSVPNSK